MTDLPHDATEREIETFFSRKIEIYDGEMELKKICMGYDTTIYNETVEKIKLKEIEYGGILAEYLFILIIFC